MKMTGRKRKADVATSKASSAKVSRNSASYQNAVAPLRLKRHYRSLRQVAPRHLGHLRQSLRKMHRTTRREGVAPLRLKRRYRSLRQVAPRHLGHLRQSLRQIQEKMTWKT
jgi:protein required for attachment to host cells